MEFIKERVHKKKIVMIQPEKKLKQMKKLGKSEYQEK
jgi:hypothetical protein